MALIERKWLRDNIVNNSKLDNTDSYVIAGMENTGDSTTLGNQFVGSLRVDNNAIVEGDSTVEGGSNLQGNTYMDSDATVGGSMLVQGDASVVGQLNIASDAILGSLQVIGPIYGQSDATIDGLLDVNNDASFSGNVRVDGSMSVGTGTLLMDGTGIRCTSNFNLNAPHNTITGESGFTGNVGVGTTNPSNYDPSANRFVIQEVSGNAGMTIASPNQGHIFFADGVSGDDRFRGSVSYDHATNKLYFGTDADTRLAIDYTGRTGIGVDTPEDKLEVIGDILIPNDFAFRARHSTGAAYDVLKSDSSGHTVLSSFGPGVPIKFFQGPSDLTGSMERMRIHSNTFVGIHTQSPVQPLHVEGNAYITADSTVGRDFHIGRDTTIGSDLLIQDTLTVNSRADFSSNIYLTGQINSGQGLTDLYLMDQNVRTVDSVVHQNLTLIGRIDTGLGLTDVYLMNQHVQTTDDVQFDNLVLSGTINTGQGATKVYLMDQDLRTNDSPSFTNLTLTGTIDTGQGSTDVFLMDQNVRTSDYVSFQNIDVSNDATVSGNIFGTNGVSNLGSPTRRFANIYTNSTIDFANKLRFVNGGNTRVAINTAGQVGIGTTNPESFSVSSNDLVVYRPSGNGGVTVRTSSSSIGTMVFTDGASFGPGWLVYDHANENMRFGVDNADRVTFDSSGVGIGITDPRSFNPLCDDLVIAGELGNAGLTLFSGGSNFGLLNFADTSNHSAGSPDTDLGPGWLVYDHGSNEMRFGQENKDRMSIDPFGNLRLIYEGNTLQFAQMAWLPGPELLFKTTTNTGTPIPIKFEQQDSGGADLVAEVKSNHVWDFKYQPTYNGVPLAVGSSVKWTSSGNNLYPSVLSHRVGIGLNDPTTFHHKADDLVITGDFGDAGITLFSGGSGQGVIDFKDTDISKANLGPGWIAYTHSTTGTANTLVFGVNEADRMVIEGTGEVGIGTSPSASLHVHESGSNCYLRLDYDIGNWGGIGKENQHLKVLNTLSGGHVILQTSGAGSVGINTDTVGAPLHVHESGSNCYLRLDYDTGNWGGIGKENQHLKVLNTLSGGHVILQTSGAGNVGINTENAESPLHVYAPSSANDCFIKIEHNGFESIIGIDDDNGVMTIENLVGHGRMDYKSGSSGHYFQNANLGIHTAPDSTYTIKVAANGIVGAAGNVTFGGSGTTYLRAGGSNQVFVKSNGVGINTSNPETPLHVYAPSSAADCFVKIEHNGFESIIGIDDDNGVMTVQNLVGHGRIDYKSGSSGHYFQNGNLGIYTAPDSTYTVKVAVNGIVGAAGNVTFGGSGTTYLRGGGGNNAYVNSNGMAISSNKAIYFIDGASWTGDAGTNQGKIQYLSDRFYINAGSNSNRIVQFRRGGSDVSYIDNSGTYVGTATNATNATNAGNADTCDNLHVGPTYNSTANRIVRTDASGYIQGGDKVIIGATNTYSDVMLRVNQSATSNDANGVWVGHSSSSTSYWPFRAVLEGTGVTWQVRGDGRVYSDFSSSMTVPADLAEWAKVKGEYTSYGPGDVVMQSSDDLTVEKANDPEFVYGVVTDRATFCGGLTGIPRKEQKKKNDKDLLGFMEDDEIRDKFNAHQIAMCGHVKVKVVGPVKIGQKIVLSETPGVGRAAKTRDERLDSFGIARENYDSVDIGLIEIRLF